MAYIDDRRGHVDCIGCPWEKVEPPKCTGHGAGPSACQQRPDRDRFAKPLPVEVKGFEIDDALDLTHVPSSEELALRARFDQLEAALRCELERAGRSHWCDGDPRKLDDAGPCKGLCHHAESCETLAECRWWCVEFSSGKMISAVKKLDEKWDESTGSERCHLLEAVRNSIRVKGQDGDHQT